MASSGERRRVDCRFATRAAVSPAANPVCSDEASCAGAGAAYPAEEGSRRTPPRRVVAAATTMESTYKDSKPYVLTDLGSQFVHYTMTELVARLNPAVHEDRR